MMIRTDYKKVCL